MNATMCDNQIAHNLECTLKNIGREHKNEMDKLQRETTMFKKDKAKLIREKEQEETKASNVYLKNGSVNFRSLRSGYKIYPLGREELQEKGCQNSFDAESHTVESSRRDERGDSVWKRYRKEPNQNFPKLIHQPRGSISIQRLAQLATPKAQVTKFRKMETLSKLRTMNLEEYDKKSKAMRYQTRRRNVMTTSAQAKYEQRMHKENYKIVRDIQELVLH